MAQANASTAALDPPVMLIPPSPAQAGHTSLGLGSEYNENPKICVAIWAQAAAALPTTGRVKGENVVTAIFFLPAFAIAACFVIFGAATFALGLLALRLFERRCGAIQGSVPVAPFFTAVTSAWALSLGFAAADIWKVRADAHSFAVAERSAITRLAGMAGADALDVPAITASLATYQNAVLEQEWGNTSQDPSSAVDRAIQTIRLAILALARGDTPPSLIDKITRDFDELQDARNQRLANAESSVSEYKWYLLLFLTALSVVALASVHADRPPAARSALSIFVVAASVSLWILAIHANPYDGIASIEFHAVSLPHAG